ncbi:MAG: DUF4177 domain-containing protein [Pseudomonadota bacterium]
MGMGAVQHYEYKITPAPTRGQKGPGVKGSEARFAHGLELAINALAAEGWDYLRSEILPSEERQGLTSSHTVYRSVLVFRRLVDGPVDGPVADLSLDTQEQEAPPTPTPVVSVSAERPMSDENTSDEQTSQPSTEDVQERALNSLYAPSDNSKQD